MQEKSAAREVVYFLHLLQIPGDLCVTATVAVSLAIPAMPQEPVVQGGTIKSQVSLVNLFATVRDKNKRIVPNLKQEDFRISEDNQEQKIAFFSKEVALPITLALL